ncbi:MAG: hypothetical protein COA47_02025 [Robiginitomaculum sp.]|nr:MAG: hypothetical protein COA47_02025 [Robiginitomaculum sp.]
MRMGKGSVLGGAVFALAIFFGSGNWNEALAEPGASCPLCAHVTKSESQTLQGEAGPAMYLKFQRRAKTVEQASTNMALLATQWRLEPFCKREPASDLTDSINGYMAQYEALAGALQACTDTCKINQNSADFCASGQALIQQNQGLEALGIAFSDTAVFLDLALADHRSTSDALNTLLDGAASEAQDVLQMDLDHLIAVTLPPERDPRIATATAEFDQAANILYSLSWAALVDDTAAELAEHLAGLSNDLRSLDDEVYVALSRARILLPLEQKQLAKRLIELSTRIEYARRSVHASKSQISASGPNTNANAIDPATENTAAGQSVASCFRKLSLDTAIASEFSRIARNELGQCRSFEPCQASASLRAERDPGSLAERLVANRGKADKLSLATQKAICR